MSIRRLTTWCKRLSRDEWLVLVHGHNDGVRVQEVINCNSWETRLAGVLSEDDKNLLELYS